jgi:peptide/nickel transport system permease protein
MSRYIVARVVQGAVGLLLLSALIFVLARLAGDPIQLMLPPEASLEQVATLRRLYGLDQPVPVQYWTFLLHAVQGDFGTSLIDHRPALQAVVDRLPATALLAVASIGVAGTIALPLGMLAAYYKGSPIDTVVQSIGLLGQSIPAFWLGLVLVELLSVNFRLLPPAGMDSAANLVLPSITLGWFSVAAVMRILRSAMIDALDSEYVKFARSKGVPELAIVVKHCLKNALVPVLSVGGVLFATFLTGTVVVETVFAWPGVGRLTYQAISKRDFPVIQTVMMTTAALVVLVNIGVDLLYGLVDPRIRQR